MFAALRRDGVLLLTDARLPSVAGMVGGAPVRGSWWAHPRAHDIFMVARGLAAHADVILARLIDRKVTFVHRTLWPSLVVVASARESWQTRGLSADARRLLHEVDEHGELRTDDVPPALRKRMRQPGNAARELEQRILVRSDEVHTASGAHAKRLESWEIWRRRVDCGKLPALSDARAALDQLIARLNRAHGASARAPWQPRQAC